MPILDTHAIAGSTYGFSATRLGDLGASEYTLVALTADVSGSVAPFLDQIELCVQRIARACRRSPRADNLLLRVTQFGSDLAEVHGFKPLPEIDPDDYVGSLAIRGLTALYDAAHNAVESVTRYGKRLLDNGFSVNGIVFVITDGNDCASALSAGAVRTALEGAVQGENVESMVSVLVGVGVADAGTAKVLSDFAADAGFTAFVQLEKAGEDTLARLADFVTRSIALQSTALGSGQALSLTF
ncbi:MAG: hypothetical protein H6704_12395 [Myxococcales bacterium]|nr:hypothetical protein [Myxococcales bacterium]MCB9537043.1 hypothetical protein [Myxococcales bacterium]